MTITSFLFRVEEIRAEKPTYRLGGDGSDGTCDCIGLIIGAIRREGGAWSGIHGTNYTVRNAVDYLQKVATEDELTVGELVFKAREPGASGYALPDRYDESPDRRDYYHVGVVTSVAPLTITHCTSPGGIKEDTKLGAWAYRAWCSAVEQKEDIIFMPYPMIVTASSGKTVNMRERPNLSAPLVKQVKIGETVSVVDETGEWSRVTYDGYAGYIMTKYLTTANESLNMPNDAELLNKLQAIRKMVDDAIELAKNA